MRSLSIAATGMLAQETNVEVISNNIANMNTTAFKTQRPEFQDLLYQDLRRIGSSSSDSGTVVPAGIQVGVGVKTGAVYRITQQGNLTSTSNSLDLAIQGKGYFQIQLPGNALAYTRDGSFQLSPTGQIVTQDGYLVQPTITVPPNATSVSISNTGLVQVSIANQVNPQTVGQLNLAIFPNDAGLEAMGQNLVLESASSGAAQLATPGSPGYGTIQQGFLETSNVDPVNEISNLITAQRAYEMNSKVITTSDQMLQDITQLR
ncbi:MAG TPA: flagellar basal-body rod protein FlgG [Candidatus Sulfotelmatobacter sp.]|jgi:flagellar basal-body rod protein FlgG|nr:flagellar basal-body rod protein FlgG [Candidatus Sulfotelmatobacter sp.]